MTDDERLILILNLSSFSSGSIWKRLSQLNISSSEVLNNLSILSRLGISDDVLEKMKKITVQNSPEVEYSRCLDFGAVPLFICNSDYPSSLRSLPSPPPIVFLYGDLPEEGGISIVGTRRCSPYGMNVSHSLAFKLASLSVPVISGGASGIDGSAHSGAIDGGYPTWAVLGTGVDMVYPASHKDLFSKIVAEGGGLLSQFPMGTKGMAFNFPKRNEIIAALSDVTVVVESPEKGGSMITARLAASLGRDLWSVPGRIGENKSLGSNRLIFDGAQPLYDIDVFTEIVSGREQLSLFREADEDLSDTISGEILAVLQEEGALTVDEIASRCHMSLPSVLESLLNLDISGKIYRSGPGRWSASL